MEENNYTFKVFDNGEYQNTQTNLISKTYCVSELSNILNEYISFPYSKFFVPEYKIKALRQLLIDNGLMSFENEILSFLIHAQYMYIEFDENYKDDLIEEFIRDDEGYKKLLNMIENYFFSEKNELVSIRFNFFTKSSSITVKGLEVLTNILNLITKSLDINKENFYERKSQIINDSKIILPNKGGRHAISKIIKTLFQYFKSKTTLSENDILNMIGDLLIIAEIDNQLSETTYQYLRNYLKRDMKNFS